MTPPSGFWPPLLLNPGDGPAEWFVVFPLIGFSSIESNSALIKAVLSQNPIAYFVSHWKFLNHLKHCASVVSVKTIAYRIKTLISVYNATSGSSSPVNVRTIHANSWVSVFELRVNSQVLAISSELWLWALHFVLSCLQTARMSVIMRSLRKTHCRWCFGGKPRRSRNSACLGG